MLGLLVILLCVCVAFTSIVNLYLFVGLMAEVIRQHDLTGWDLQAIETMDEMNMFDSIPRLKRNGIFKAIQDFRKNGVEVSYLVPTALPPPPPSAPLISKN